jgi:hypothetical protein
VKSAILRPARVTSVVGYGGFKPVSGVYQPIALVGERSLMAAATRPVSQVGAALVGAALNLQRPSDGRTVRGL